MIDEARRVGINLDVELVRYLKKIIFKLLIYYAFEIYNGVHLLNTKWNPANINTFATKLLSVLFNKEEIAKGYIEPGPKSRYPTLDEDRLNLIKGLFCNFFDYNIIFYNPFKSA